MSDTGQVSGKAAVDLAFVAYDQGKKDGRAEAAPPTRREAVWTTTAGEVRLSYPEPMPVWEVDFLEEFVALWLRGVRRRAETSEAAIPLAEGSPEAAQVVASDPGRPKEPPK